MDLALNTMSLALFGLAAAAYARRRGTVLLAAAVLFFPVAAGATLAVWWPLCPTAGSLILALTLGVPLALMAVFAVDVIWAPFCLEMTYLTFLCWLICPVGVGLNWIGSALARLSGAA